MSRRPISDGTIERPFFFVVLALLSIAAFAIVWPYWGALFWAAVLALLFRPLYLALLRRFRNRGAWAALATLAVILVIVILPLGLVAVSLIQEVTLLYQRVKSGEVDFGRYFSQIVAALPSWVTGQLANVGLGDLAALQAKLTAAITQRGQALALRAVDIGQDTLDWLVSFVVAMYVLFFLLVDGARIAGEVRQAIPLAPGVRDRLLERLTTVVRATVKGNILVAAAQGALGGLAFWVLGVHAPMLWAVVMGFLSLLPAVGAALVWGPVALYLLATGATWKGIALIAFGTFVIGLIDNVLRPILVGKDTRMSDWIVLLSTIGGLAIVGLNGFVIGPLVVAMAIAAWQILTVERGRADAADAP